MKKIFLLLITSLSLFAATINFEKDLQTAKQKAVKENKKLMIMYSTPSCPECNYMKKKVFKNNELASYMNKNYVSVVMDIKKDKDKLPYKFIGIPTFYFSNASDMKLLGKRIGGTRESQFLQIAKSIK
jgi:thioredoxin-related protein